MFGTSATGSSAFCSQPTSALIPSIIQQLRQIHYFVLGFSAGERVDINRSIPLPAGRTLRYAWLRIKEEKGDPDPNSLVQKLVTTDPSPFVGIISSNTGGVASVTFQLSEGETLKISPYRVVWFEITTQWDDGTTAIWQDGILTLSRRVTNASS